MEYIVYCKLSIGIILFTLIDKNLTISCAREADVKFISNSRTMIYDWSYNREKCKEGIVSSSKYPFSGQNEKRAFVDDDQRAERKKRDVTKNSSYNFGNQGNGSLEASSIHLINQDDVIERPDWLNKSQNQNWYGIEFYLNRTVYMRDKNKPPTVCFNNITKVENNTRMLLYFICPMSHQGNTLKYCCGKDGQQVCCTKLAYDTEQKKLKEDEFSLNDIDLVTGLSIAGACAACITLCMLLYCCCCQRRPEIHDGIKLMWVRRSFGKELSRLEQPTYPNHLAVVSSSRAASRSGSRSGSRFGSHQGSRNPSRGPSPSVSRRESYERSPSKKHKVTAGPSDRQRLTVDVPSSVVITVTTPSDEHGPTNPLLKSME